MARLGLFSRLASVSAGTAACSELVPGLILLPRPPFPNTRFCPGPGAVLRPQASLEVHGEKQHVGKGRDRSTISLTCATPHLTGPTMRHLPQDTQPVKPGGCWWKCLPKTSPQPPGFHLSLAVALQPHRPGLSGAACGYRESWAGEGHCGHTAGIRSRAEEVCRRDSLGARSG